MAGTSNGVTWDHVVVFTASGLYIPPPSFNPQSNQIECLGAGNTGGGAYARSNNCAIAAGQQIIINVPLANTATAAYVSDPTGSVVCQAASANGTAGGTVAACIGTSVTYAGGDSHQIVGAGGGGAAGPNGAGASVSASNYHTAGGAADGGTVAGGAAGGQYQGGSPGNSGTEWYDGATTYGCGSGGGGGGDTTGDTGGGAGGYYGGGGGWNRRANNPTTGRGGLVIVAWNEISHQSAAAVGL
jgi:hypothetical protein